MMRSGLIVVTWFAVLGCGDDAPDNPDAGPGGDGQDTCATTTPWASGPALPLGATQETAALAVDGKVYVLGGFNAQDGITAKVQVFDVASCTWSLGPAMPRPVHHINAGVVDGTLFVVGAMETNAFTAIGDTWSWNPATDATWQIRTPMPAGTQRGSAIVGAIDGKLYVAGGLRAGAVTDVSVYDPALDRWTAQPPLPVARDHGCGGVVGGKLYVTGGRQATIGSTSPAVFELTPGGGWIDREPMPTGRGGTACGVVGDRIIVVGGEGNPDDPSGVFPQVEAYAPATNTWQTLDPMPTPRHGMGAAAIGDKLYVPGGATQDGFGAVATFEIFTP